MNYQPPDPPDEGNCPCCNSWVTRDEMCGDRCYECADPDSLEKKAGKTFAIVPGMIATVDIATGHKTVLDYLTKPLNRAKEALRER